MHLSPRSVRRFFLVLVLILCTDLKYGDVVFGTCLNNFQMGENKPVIMHSYKLKKSSKRFKTDFTIFTFFDFVYFFTSNLSLKQLVKY